LKLLGEHELATIGSGDALGQPDRAGANAGAGVGTGSEGRRADVAAQRPADKGKLLHASLLGRHAGIDHYYRRPVLWGAATGQPLAVICVPIDDWSGLTADDRGDLKAYAASLVNLVQSDPFTYSGIPASAPAAPLVRRNAAGMTAASWGVLVGKLSPDGRDILSDEIVVRGN
jgi:hypothetical protein